MRLDARQGDTGPGWFIWHVEQAREISHAVWVDDEINQWGEFIVPAKVRFGDDLETQTFQAKQIRIIPASRLILINPIADPDESTVDKMAAKPIICARTTQTSENSPARA